jgi:Skp family chaperone for outer membrane proteins
VKRTVAILSGLAALGGLAYLATATTAQQPGAAPAPAAAAPRGKVGVVNINRVIKGYNKANVLGQYLLSLSKYYADQRNAKQAKITELQQAASKEADVAKRDAMAAEVRKLAREIEDIDGVAQKEVTQKQGEIASQVYKEIEGVIAGVARSYDLELVLSFPDATSPEEAGLPATIFRKLSAPAALPIYFAPNLDITQAVVDTLNRTFPAPVAQPAAPAPMGAPAAAPPAAAPPMQ